MIPATQQQAPSLASHTSAASNTAAGKIYISGKISDLPKHEYESRFNVAEQGLKELGYITVNPLSIHTHSLQSSHARRHGKMRGAIMFALIFFVSFLYQDKKESQCGEHKKTITLLLAMLISFALHAQLTISPAFAFGTYKHYIGSAAKPTAMLNITPGYQYKLLQTELSILIPLDNAHPVSASIQAGINIPITEKINIAITAGPEAHIQQLYKYPIDTKDTPYKQLHNLQPSGKLRISKQFQDDAITQLYTEISYEQHMPLLKFGIHIIITKKQ
jgi:hypothetical protein